jgi:NAD(P)-dependent dehydrogenase (short-subunit alcohol dehydrogenase family)
MNEQDKPVALVTGISKGFGFAVASSLAKAGWYVIGDARSSSELEHAIRLLGGAEFAIGITGDVADPSHRDKLVAALKQVGGLQLLVNNAGALGPSPMPALVDAKPGDLIAVLEVNTAAPLALMQSCTPYLLAAGGTIVNITSDAASEDYEGWGLYSVSKVALEKLSSIFALENPHLRVYSLDPGDMRTDMHQAAFPGEDISDRALPEESSDAVLALANNGLPSGRYRAAELLN